jgi:hypothetical protein
MLKRVLSVFCILTNSCLTFYLEGRLQKNKFLSKRLKDVATAFYFVFVLGSKIIISVSFGLWKKINFASSINVLQHSNRLKVETGGIISKRKVFTCCMCQGNSENST